MKHLALPLDQWARTHTDRAVMVTIEHGTLRLPDRADGAFGQGRTTNKLTPQGRPSDIFGDVIVTVSRVRALEITK